MKEKRNVHLKVQELCDCYATNDPLKEMSVVKMARIKKKLLSNGWRWPRCTV